MTPSGTMALRNAWDDPKDSAAIPSFASLLFLNEQNWSEIDSRKEPECFRDLNLDQVIESAVARRDEYSLKPFFYCGPQDPATVSYRQEIFRDLETKMVADSVRSFALAMRTVYRYLETVEKLFYRRQKQRWFVEAVDTYCRGVRDLANELQTSGLQSTGLQSLRVYLESYTKSEAFCALEPGAQGLVAHLNDIRYYLHIEGKRIVVAQYEEGVDYGTEVLRVFEKFRQEASKDYHFNLRSDADMNHVEAAILDMVAQLYPEIFSSIEEYCTRYRDFLSTTIVRVDREFQFYLAWHEYMQRFARAGLSYCYPGVSAESKEIAAQDAFDLALADNLVRHNRSVVTNDFFLAGPERTIVVSGPNQGGKTTFARMFGQLHYLASLGCPVPAKRAQLFLCDRLFTHFEKEENLQNLSGKLEDELLRIRRIFEAATSNSILIMNESFLSTTLQDAVFLSKQVMQRIIELDMLCVSVTFIDELASLGPTVVSMVSTVNPDNPVLRTFRVVRRPADGLAYAAAIAEKYELTYEQVKARITGNVAEGSA